MTSEWQKLRNVSSVDLIAGFAHQPTEDEKPLVSELVEMALHKRQVAEIIVNTFDANYACDLTWCMRYTLGGERLLYSFFWLFKAIRRADVENILSESFIQHIIKLHDLKPKK